VRSEIIATTFWIGKEKVKKFRRNEHRQQLGGITMRSAYSTPAATVVSIAEQHAVCVASPSSRYMRCTGA